MKGGKEQVNEVASLEGRTVLVTGAGGFIGRSVVKALLAKGARVQALLGPSDDASPFTSCNRFSGCSGDITDTALLRQIARGAEIAVHLAGPPSVRASFDSPVEYARTHVAGAAALFEVCHSTDIRRVVHISSAEVYGRSLTASVREDHPLHPRSPYGAAKLGAEHFVRTLTETFGTSAVILRPFSVYGPGLSPESLIGAILKMARSSEAIVLHDLAPVRDYCFVDDVAEAVLRACVHSVEGVVTCNIGTGRGTNVADLAGTILRLLGRLIPILESPDKCRRRNAEIYRLVADTGLAWSVLNWRANIPLEMGLKQTLQSLMP